MSTETRQAFNLSNQKEKDILAAVKTITPVISIIREWGKAEREISEVKGKLKKNNAEYQRLSSIADRITEIGKNALNIAFERNYEERKKLSERVNKLQEVCNNFEKQVINYQNYVRTFKHVEGNIIQMIQGSNLFENEEDSVCFLVFFIYNIDEDLRKYEYLFNKVSSYFEEKQIECSWTNILQYLKNN